MKTKTKSTVTCVALALPALLTLNLQPATAHAQGTAFTYQGRLNNNGSPGAGTYDLTFALFNTNTTGVPIAGPVTNSAVSVTNGLFTVLVDFGPGVFTGGTNWLEIGVETNGVNSFTALTPRQQLTPTPYAIFAENANAAGLSGTVPTASVSGIYGSALTFSNAGNSFTGNGGGLSGVNAVALNGLNTSNFWQTAGNTGTSPAGGNFVGTTDNQALELRVNGSRALRLEPGNTNGAPNLIGGSPVNFVSAGVVGAVIGGGGTTNFFGIAYTNRVLADFGAIGGGLDNSVVNDYASVAGGIGNSGGGGSAVVGGGAYNYAGADYSAVGGGFANSATGIGAFIGGGGYDGSTYQGNQSAGNASFIGGGLDNISSNLYSIVVGGFNNTAGGDASVISGGEYNTTYGSGDHSTIGGGQNNSTFNSSSTVGGGNGNLANGNNSTVAGGSQNVAYGYNGTTGGGNNNVDYGEGDTLAGGENNSSGGGNLSTISGGVNNNSSGSYAVIGGGQNNAVGDSYSTIGGGVNNLATNNSSLVSGGTNNVAGGYASTVAGGSDNQAQGDYSFAAGNFAQATNNHSFVWSDGSTNTTSSTNNQFVARAVNGFVFYSDTAGTGVSLAPGSGSWSTMSDRNAKNDFTPVNPQAVLARVAALPLTTWSYQTEPGVRHVGPMAQDFHAAFAVGEDDRHIAEVDEGGVALAAIQGLNQKLESEVKEKDAEIQELKQRLEALEKIVLNQKSN